MPNATLPHRNLPRLLLQAREAVMAHFRPGLRAAGLSDQQWRVLRVLGEHAARYPDDTLGLETGRIARAAYLLGPSLTGVLQRMEKAGLVERGRDPQDARRSVVRASALGLAKVAALSDAIEAHYQALEQQLGQTGLQQLYGLLDALITAEGPENEAENETHGEPGEHEEL